MIHYDALSDSWWLLGATPKWAEYGHGSYIVTEGSRGPARTALLRRSATLPGGPRCMLAANHRDSRSRGEWNPLATLGFFAGDPSPCAGALGPASRHHPQRSNEISICALQTSSKHSINSLGLLPGHSSPRGTSLHRSPLPDRHHRMAT